MELLTPSVCLVPAQVSIEEIRRRIAEASGFGSRSGRRTASPKFRD